MSEKVRKVAVADMEIGYGTQCRYNGTNSAIVEEFADMMKAGEKVPPVILYEDDRTEAYEGKKVLIIGDGFKRRQAAMKIGLSELDAVVRPGGKFDAMQCNVKENGEQLAERWELKDRKHACRLLLAEPEGAAKSNPWLAKLCHLDEATVAKIRLEGESGGAPRPTRRTARDGRTYTAKSPSGKSHTNGAAPAPKQGAPKYDWREFNRAFGVVARAPDDIVRAYSEEKNGTEHPAAMRALQVVARIMKGWERRILKIKKE